MSIAIPDPDLPWGDGTECSVDEVAGLQIIATECPNGGGLFYRVTCGSVELDINPTRVRITGNVEVVGRITTDSLVVGGVNIENHVHRYTGGTTEGPE